MTAIPIVIGVLGTENNPQVLGKEAGSVGNQRTNRDHPNYRIVETTQDTEKAPEDLRRLTFTQVPVKDYQLRLL